MSDWTAPVEAPGPLTPGDHEALALRTVLSAARIAALGRRGVAVVLSAAWPGPGSWQHAWATTGRHPLACAACGARTLHPLGDGRVACPTCESGPEADPRSLA